MACHCHGNQNIQFLPQKKIYLYKLIIVTEVNWLIILHVENDPYVKLLLNFSDLWNSSSGCVAVWTYRLITTFWRNLLFSSSWLKRRWGEEVGKWIQREPGCWVSYPSYWGLGTRTLFLGFCISSKHFIQSEAHQEDLPLDKQIHFTRCHLVVVFWDLLAIHLQLCADLLDTDCAVVNQITFKKCLQVSSDNRARHCNKFQHLQKAQHPFPFLLKARLLSTITSYFRHNWPCLKVWTVLWLSQFLAWRKPFVYCLLRLQKKSSRRRSGSWSIQEDLKTLTGVEK